MVNNVTIDYLRKLEWSMGNGQCPECDGVNSDWHGHPLHMTTENIGHDHSCKLAKSLKECGDNPLMKGEFQSDTEYENYISEKGLFGVRLKTKDGCMRYKEYVDKVDKQINESIIEMLNNS